VLYQQQPCLPQWRRETQVVGLLDCHARCQMHASIPEQLLKLRRRGHRHDAQA